MIRKLAQTTLSLPWILALAAFILPATTQGSDKADPNPVIMITEAIYAEAVLSFLGLGDPTSISWGMMLNSVFESGVIAESYW